LETWFEINAVLGNVTSIFVPADLHNGVELTALDNFSLVTPVPEPASWSLLAGGGAALLATLRRHRTNRERAR
jgi:hypothetical protein